MIIRCPQCKKQYNLKSSHPQALLGKQFTCPNCSFSVPFMVLLKNSTPDNPDLHTHIVGSGANGARQPMGGQSTQVFGQPTQVASNHTHIYGQQAFMQNQQVYLEIEGTQQRFPLQMGTYILGRNSVDSPATIKLAPDPYMSRSHAKLDVLYRGGQLICAITAFPNANPVYINGQALPPTKAILLKNGVTIQMGMTKIKFVQNA